MTSASNPNDHTPPRPELDTELALRHILEGTAAETGGGFFAALVQHLCEALGTDSAWVTEWLPISRRLNIVAFWHNGRLAPNREYDVTGTPCELVVEENRLVVIPEDVMSKFSNDPDLPEMGAVSYIGVPLTDVDGRIMGHLAVQDSREMTGDERIPAVFQIFAARAAAELQRLRAECEVREREEKLERLVDSALDAIVELDAQLRITRINSAAEGVFVITADQVSGRDFGILVDRASRSKLERLCAELERLPAGKRYVWISGGLNGRRSDGGEFPAEGTLSRYEAGQQTFFTLIIRNVNDRLEAEKTIETLTAETEYLQDELRDLQGFDEILGTSKALESVLTAIQQVAATDSTVLILGETGTGKELVARAVHANGNRRDAPFVKVNCAAIPEGLIESEFFGHEKGAFTGATRTREGRFARAHGGTIFLDEIGELPLTLQAKLLRVLQDGEFEPVGSSHSVTVDVRVLAATNRDLEEQVRAGAFREDLYYRVNVFPIRVPPLRERAEDIQLLARAFADRIARRMGREVRPVDDECVARLLTYDWPGNVRELQNVMERAVITAREGRVMVDRFDQAGLVSSLKAQEAASISGGEKRIRTMEEMRTLERQNILMALEATGWLVSGDGGAARLLGMPPSTLGSRMKTLGITKPHE